MNIALWILQIFLALHTLVGAGWKLGNSSMSIPSLKAIPHGLWLALIGFEVVCALGLVVPALLRNVGYLVPIAAVGIALEMLMFCMLHIVSDETQNGPMVYWAVVIAVCAVVAFGRAVLAPL